MTLALIVYIVALAVAAVYQARIVRRLRRLDAKLADINAGEALR